FDRNAYRRVLNENHLTDSKFKENIGSQIALQQMGSTLSAGMKPTAILAAYQALMVHQNRDVSVLYITPAMAGAVPAPTDAQLTAFMTENADKIQVPETRVLTIARFKLNDVAATVTPTEADIQKIIDFRKSDQTTPETRTLVQISAKDLATAQTIASRLAKGEDAATVARAVGSTVTSYDNKPKTAIPDAKTADAAFALAAGATSQPIQGSLGYSVVRVLSITPAKLPDMAKLRADAITEAKHRAAQMKVTEQANKFEEAINAGTDMVEAARTTGAHVTTTPPVALNGSDKDGHPPEGVTARLMQEVAALQLNEKSDIVEESPNSGDYFVVRVDKINPAALPPLAEVRSKLVPIWTAQEQTKRMQAKATELAGKAREGTSLADLAKQNGGSVTQVTGLNIADAQTLSQKYGQKLVQGAMSTKKGETYTGDAPPAAGQTGPGVFFVARVDEIHQADAAASAPEGQRLLPQIAQALGTEMEDQLVRSSSKLVSVKSYPERARDALGLAPLPKAGAEPKDKAGGAAKK
ncbi:MAG: peptidyl-prolyl cis-trans isomerase, partial [Alphaproteobacteria bacterium]